MVSSYSVAKYTPQQGSLLRRLKPFFSSQTTGHTIPYTVQVKDIAFSAFRRRMSHSSITYLYNKERSLFKPRTSLHRKPSYPATTPGHENAPLSSLSTFVRPYAIIGLVITIISTSLLPVETLADLSPSFFIGLLQTIIAMVLIIIYNIAVNQVYDIELDKVNKPYLPLASGGFSMKTGAAIVAFSSFMSISIGLMLQSPPLLCAILTIFLFGGAYSIDLPFLRWKKDAILAVVCTVAWGLALQIGIFLHIQKYVLGKPMFFTRPAIFATITHAIFGVAVALVKDLPDVEGDKAHGCDNMTIRFGKEKVFWGCTILMLVMYCAAIVMGVYSPLFISKLITVLGHSVVALVLWRRAQQIDLSDDESTQSYYMFIWKLSGVEAFLIPFVR